MTPAIVVAGLDERGRNFLLVFARVLCGGAIAWLLAWGWKNKKIPLVGNFSCTLICRDTAPVGYWLLMVVYFLFAVALIGHTILHLAGFVR